MSATIESIRQTLSSQKKSLFQKANVVAVGIGYKTVQGTKTDSLSIICSVKAKQSPADLSAEDLIPADVEGIPTDVLETGEIAALQDTTGKFRPAPGGVSVGHRFITAGTLGCWVKKNGEFHILSNNHVLANRNDASIGDAILQPGPHDSGVYPKDQIAELTQFIPIDFGDGDNIIDAAIARAVEVENGGSLCPFASTIASLLNRAASGVGSKTRMKPVKIASIDDIVKNEILNIGVVNELTEATLGMEVKKMGRTTGLTTGEITQVDVSVRVNYGNSRSAWFVDQFMTGNISQGGDSGSLVVSNDNKAVGLLFAGSDVISVVNRIEHVFSALEITF
ncbi:MAG: hypothetical protein Kow0042_13130 [Calditrichia bacterium]